MDLQKRLVSITLEEKSGQHKNPCCRIITTTGVLLSIVRFYRTCSHTDKGIFYANLRRDSMTFPKMCTPCASAPEKRRGG